MHVFSSIVQGRFKSFPVQNDEQLLGLSRYVERNALTAGLVDRARLWGEAACGRERAHGGDKSIFIALTGGTAGELDGLR